MKEEPFFSKQEFCTCDEPAIVEKYEYGQRTKSVNHKPITEKILIFYTWCKKCGLQPKNATENKHHHSHLLK